MHLVRSRPQTCLDVMLTFTMSLPKDALSGIQVHLKHVVFVMQQPH